MKVATSRTAPKFHPVAVIVQCDTQAELDALTAIMSHTSVVPASLSRKGSEVGPHLARQGMTPAKIGSFMRDVAKACFAAGGRPA